MATTLLALLGTAGAAIGSAAASAGSAIGSAAGSVASGIGQAAGAVGQAAGQVGSAIGQGAQAVGQGLGQAAESVGQAAGQVGQYVGSAFGGGGGGGVVGKTPVNFGPMSLGGSSGPSMPASFSTPLFGSGGAPVNMGPTSLGGGPSQTLGGALQSGSARGLFGPGGGTSWLSQAQDLYGKYGKYARLLQAGQGGQPQGGLAQQEQAPVGGLMRGQPSVYQPFQWVGNRMPPGFAYGGLYDWRRYT